MQKESETVLIYIRDSQYDGGTFSDKRILGMLDGGTLTLIVVLTM